MIKLRSFRIRLALMSAALAGSALIGFGLLSAWLIYQAKVSRLDAELQNQLLIAGRPRSLDHWQSNPALLPQTVGAQIAILMIDADGKERYRSPEWDADLTIPSRSHPPQPLQRPRSANQRSPLEAQTNPSTSTRPPLPPDRWHPPEGPPPAPRFVTQHTTTGNWRLGTVTTPLTQVAIAANLNAINQEMAVIRTIFLISIPGVLLLVAGGAWMIAGHSLQPIRQLTSVIGAVTATGLEQRVPIGSTEVEFVELIQVFNQMLERLERSFKQSSRFSADAAHELKTPLAILQGELERTLQQADPGSEVQQSLSNLLDEVRRLSGIVRKLLLLSLADAGQMTLHRVEVNVSRLLFEMLEDIELLAPHLDVHSEIADRLCVQGDRDLLIQVLQNLISNAIKYNLPHGWIRIVARAQGTAILMTISNASTEILARDRTRIFDRFHRGDPARTRKVEGIGLGLSLAQEIVQAHRGTLTLDSTPPGETAFTLTLPAGGNVRGSPK